MDVMDAIKKRRSVRNYQDRKIDQEDILKLIEAARLSPSARNIQNRKYVVLEDIDDKVVDACNGQAWVSTSAAIVVGIVDPSINRWADTDMAIAFEHMVLEAVEIGLGTCWIGAFDDGKVKDIIGVPEDMKVYALLAVGYPASDPPQSTRKKPIGDIWSKDRYAW